MVCIVLGKQKKTIMKEYMSSHIYKPKTINQQKYLTAIDNEENKLIIVHGPAGTGKTLFACVNAIEYLKNNIVEKIVLTRPVVSVEEEIGYLPGNINQKMDPWTRPLFDIFLEYYKKQDIDRMIENQIIEIIPLGYMRGRTFKNSYIIADEMQNSSPNQFKMITTRLGCNSRMVVTGDLKQSDLKENNGLTDFLNRCKFKNLNEISIIKLEQTDVERSNIVKTVLGIYE
jgi:phosphate starvation-inducible PhoH-like protein